MFARFSKKNTHEEQQPLIPKNRLVQSRDAFDKVPNDVMINIASFLTPKEMASFGLANKRMHALVEKTPTAFEVHQLVDGETQVTKNATYAQLRKAFIERAPLERQLKKTQPSKLLKKIRERERCIAITCSTTTMLTGALAVVSGGPLMSVSPPLGITAWVGGAVGTFCFPLCISRSSEIFERQQVRRDEQIQALEERLKAKPQVIAMRK